MDVTEENFVPDYDDDIMDDEEVSSTTSKKSKKHKTTCCLCSIMVKNLKRHLINSHFPIQFNSENHTCINCTEVIVESLLRLASKFNLQSIEALFHYFIDNSLSKPGFKQCKISKDDIHLLDNVSALLQIHSVEYKLHPPNSPAVLAHWRILSVLLSHLNHVDLLEFQYTSTFNLCSSAENVLSDSHFHLDQSLKKTNSTCFSDILVPSNLPVAVAINNCCFFRLPSLEEINSIHKEDNRIYFSIGSHPRFIHSPPSSLVQDITSLAESPLVVGIGEIGLDFTASDPEHRKKQSSFIVSLLSIAVKFNKVLVIHCRDVESQTLAFEQLLSLFEQHVPKFHPIHFHCFTYSTSHMYLWLDHFPNSFFGVTSILFKSHLFPIHKHLLTHINLHQILLESDSPYLASSSSALQTITQRFAKLRRIPLPQFNTLIFQNTKRLYKF